MNASIVFAIVTLIAVSVAVFLIWLKWIAWDFIKGRRTSTVRPATLKDVLMIVLLFPVYFTCGIGAVWLIYQGWTGFARAVLTCAEGSFGFGFFLAFVYLCANIAARRLAKKS